MAAVVSVLPRHGIDMERNIEWAKLECSSQYRPKAKQRPPTEPVGAQEEYTPAEQKSHRSIQGTDVCFHGSFGFNPNISPWPPFRCAFLGTVWSDLEPAESSNPPARSGRRPGLPCSGLRICRQGGRVISIARQAGTEVRAPRGNKSPCSLNRRRTLPPARCRMPPTYRWRRSCRRRAGA
jgi:hypothetical protein